MAKARTAVEAEAAILHAARLAFSATGFAGTPVQQIARDADVSTGLIYHYYRDKEALWQAVGDAAVQHCLQDIEAHARIESQMEPWQQFVSLLRFGMQYGLNHPETLRLSQWNTLSPSPHYAAQAIDTFLCETVAALQQARVVRLDVPAAELAGYVSVSMKGWTQSQVAQTGPAQPHAKLGPRDEQWLTLMLAALRKE